MIAFTIEIESDPPRAVAVCIYETVGAMRSATTRYTNRDRAKSRRQHGRYGETLGICHRFELVSSDGGAWESHPLCAIIRMARGHLGIGIVSHECAHAATWIHELDHGKAVAVEEDEDFCWVLGELVRQVVNQFWDRGIYAS